jgi:Guanosine polyphosphate pyrophosphohydrolases/synthetases
MDTAFLYAIKKAADMAAKAHQGQYRDDGQTPYIVHPARVAMLVALFGGDHRAVITAWLHDLLEECPGRKGELFLQQALATPSLPADDRKIICDMIRSLTKDEDVPDEQRLQDSLARIISAPSGATLVKLCDRLDNLTDLTDSSKNPDNYISSTNNLIGFLSKRASDLGYQEPLFLIMEMAGRYTERDT